MKMTDTLLMKLNEIQPSQLFISSEKLSEIMKAFDQAKPDTLEPIPVKKLGNEVVFTDGHTRALAAFLHGLGEARVFWDEDELDWEAYAICVEWCKKEGIRTVGGLKDWVVSPEEYTALWLDRCGRMHRYSHAKRKRATSKSTKAKTDTR